MYDGTISEIRMFAANFAPKYWAFCAGQLLPINQNQALFSLLGTSFGGNGVTSFALPDLRGRVAIGTGSGPGLTNRNIGEAGGAPTHTLIVSEMPAHTHVSFLSGTAKLSVSSAAASMTTAVAGASIAKPIKATGRSSTQLLGFNDLQQPNVALASTSIEGQLTVTNGVAGANLAHDNMQPYLGMNYIICLQGIYPSRN